MSSAPAVVADLVARGDARRERGDLAGAERLYREAIAADPAAAAPHHHLASVALAQGDLAAAEAGYRRALELAPQAAATARALAVLLLSQGRYAEGFGLFEARHALAQYAKPELPFPEWRGGDVAGRRLLIWPEQGFGDQIQFARFAPVLQALGADVTLVCWPALARLFAGSLGVRVIAAAGEVTFPDPDGWLMAMSLAGRLGVTPQTLPNAPYLRALDPPPPLPSGVRVGLMTRGAPHYGADATRSLSDEAAEALRKLPAAMIDLAPEATGARDFADTAAIVQGLDLVISVDTAVAHLAGAMGKPVWILLPAANTDWRWLRERRDSPWYPSARLYRQAPGEDWGALVAEVARDVAALLAGRA